MLKATSMAMVLAPTAAITGAEDPFIESGTALDFRSSFFNSVAT